MAHYKVVFESYSDGVFEVPCFVEFDRERFTHREWKLVLARLFDLFMDCENKHMCAVVYRNDGVCFFLESKTIDRIDRIDTLVWVKGILYRIMNIAE